jgi:hypothetical protein
LRLKRLKDNLFLLHASKSIKLKLL